MLARVNSQHMSHPKGSFPRHHGPQRNRPAMRGKFCARRSVHRVITCTTQRRIRIVPRVRVPTRDGTTLTSCPLLTYPIISGFVNILPKLKKGRTSIVFYTKGSDIFAFLRKIVSRIIRLFPSECVRLNKSRTQGAR